MFRLALAQMGYAFIVIFCVVGVFTVAYIVYMDMRDKHINKKFESRLRKELAEPSPGVVIVQPTTVQRIDSYGRTLNDAD